MTTQQQEGAPAEAKEIANQNLFAIAVVTGIIGFFIIKFVPALAAISLILVWPAFVAAASSVRLMCRYGLGTGTSSIGYWGTAVGATTTFASQFIGNEAYSPFVEIIVAFVVGAVTGLCANKIVHMKIPRIELNSAILAGSTAIITLVVLELFTGESGIASIDLYYTYPIIYLATTLAVLHPYNGSMGANENQPRTLKLALCEAALTTALFGVISLIIPHTSTSIAVSVIIISAIGLIIATKIWWQAVKKDAYEITWTGFPPAEH
jgi:tetrahydromethanopterin S-methyltransferase subunit C